MEKIFQIIFIFFLSSYFIFCAESPQDEPKVNLRVFGGNLVQRNHIWRPGFIVYVLYFANYAQKPTPDYECTANIIKPSWIVGMGFCLEFVDPSRERLEVGTVGLQGGNFVRVLTETYQAPGYNTATLENNIALGKVDQPFPLDTGDLFAALLPNPSWQADQFTGAPLIACGHRHAYSNVDLFTNLATCGFFFPRNRLRCASFFTNPPLRSNEICVESTDFTVMAICNGDFGGGLIYYTEENGVRNFTLYAIASYIYPNNCATSPAVFVLLPGFVQWINSIAV